MYEIICATNTAPDDLGDMALYLLRRVPVRLSIFVFVVFIALNTTAFVDRVLTRWSGAVEGRAPSNRGVVIQAALMTILFIIFAVAVDASVL